MSQRWYLYCFIYPLCILLAKYKVRCETTSRYERVGLTNPVWTWNDCRFTEVRHCPRTLRWTPSHACDTPPYPFAELPSLVKLSRPPTSFPFLRQNKYKRSLLSPCSRPSQLKKQLRKATQLPQLSGYKHATATRYPPGLLAHGSTSHRVAQSRPLPRRSWCPLRKRRHGVRSCHRPGSEQPSRMLWDWLHYLLPGQVCLLRLCCWDDLFRGRGTIDV